MSKINSIKYNFALNLANTVVGLLFPIVTFPYVSRIIMADGIGQIQFFQSIINCIVLFSALGIPLYAVREIARVRDDVEQRSKLTIEILLLHTLLSVLGYVAVYIIVLTVGKVKADALLFVLLSANILLSAIGVAWFYQAIEDFKYITIRSLVVRLLSLIALFTLVHSKDDLFVYAGITVMAEVGSNVLNFFRLRKFVTLQAITFKNLNIQRHLRPALKIFVLNIIVCIYVNIDSIMLGFLSSQVAVGYYAAATRLTKALLGVISSLGIVLLPRFANLISMGKYNEFAQTANKASHFIVALSLPMSVGLIFIAPPLIHLFCGDGFGASILTLQIVSPIIICIGLSGLLGMQILYPQGKENIVILSTMVGAVLNFTLNYLLIPKYAQYGAAAATFVAELFVLVAMLILGRKFIPLTLLSRKNGMILLSTSVLALFLYAFSALNLPDYLLLLIEIILSVFVYGGMLYFCKNEFMLQFLATIKNKIR